MTNVITLSNIAALRANVGGATEPAIWLDGYTNPADGGEGMFVYVSTDTTSADNGGTIILDANTPTANRYYRARNGDVFNIFWFGAPNNGTSDCTTALNDALAALPSGGGQIYFPPGKFHFSSAISYTVPAADKPFSVSFVGAGQDATTLYWPSTNGITIYCSDGSHTVHFRDMSLTTGAAGAHVGITISQSANLGYVQQSEFVRLTLQGDYPDRGTAYWSVAIDIALQSFVTYDTLIINGNNAGYGVSISGNATNEYYSIVHNFSKCGFFGLGTGIYYGDYLQGVTVDQCNFTNGDFGIVVITGATGPLSELIVTSCQFNTTDDQISIGSPLGQFFCANNLITIPENEAGIYIGSAANISDATFTGNQFAGQSATGSYGIFTDPATTSSLNVVIGNNFSSLAVGVQLGTHTSDWNVQANRYNTVTNNVVNNGAGNSIGVATQ